MIFRRNDNDGFESSSLWGRITSPFRSVGRFFASKFDGDASFGVEKSWWEWVAIGVTLPFRFLLGIMVFMIQAWTSSRPGWAFVRAIPAMAVMMVFFIALLAADYIHNESRRISTNLGYLGYQLNQSPDHPEYAQIFAEKLVMLQPESPNNKYELARILEKKGETARALDLMSSVAPVERPGFSKAHTWLANYYIRSDSNVEGSPNQELIRRHLDLAIKTSPDNQFAHYTLANLGIAAMKELDDGSEEHQAKRKLVIEHLATIADAPFTREGIDLQLAVIPKLLELQLEIGDKQGARKRLQNELSRLDDLAGRLPDAQAMEVRKVMVKTALSVNDYARASQFIQDLRQLAKTELAVRQLRELLSAFYLQRAGDFEDMSDRNQFSNRLKFLCEAVNSYPRNRIAAEQIMSFIASEQPVSGDSDPDPNGTVSLDPDIGNQPVVNLNWIRGIRTEKQQIMGVIHVLLGIYEVSNGNVAEGEKHWRIADKQNRVVQLMIDQMVQIAAFHRPEDFSNQLDMISLAIELFPVQPIFYLTRGMLLQDLGRYDEAIMDLAYASDELPKLISVHTNLITCYEKVGNDAAVLEQQEKLEQKLSQFDKATRKKVEAEIKRLSVVD